MKQRLYRRSQISDDLFRIDERRYNVQQMSVIIQKSISSQPQPPDPFISSFPATVEDSVYPMYHTTEIEEKRKELHPTRIDEILYRLTTLEQSVSELKIQITQLALQYNNYISTVLHQKQQSSPPIGILETHKDEATDPYSEFEMLVDELSKHVSRFLFKDYLLALVEFPKKLQSQYGTYQLYIIIPPLSELTETVASVAYQEPPSHLVGDTSTRDVTSFLKDHGILARACEELKLKNVEVSFLEMDEYKKLKTQIEEEELITELCIAEIENTT